MRLSAPRPVRADRGHDRLAPAGSGWPVVREWAAGIRSGLAPDVELVGLAWMCRYQHAVETYSGDEAGRLRLAMEVYIANTTARTWADAATGDSDAIVSCAASSRYDPIVRFSDLASTGLTEPVSRDRDPGATWARTAVMLSCVPLAAALLLLLFRRHGSRGRTPHGRDQQIGLVQQPWEDRGTNGERLARTLAWAMLTILPVPAASLTLAAGEARAEADVQASDIYTSIGVSGQVDSLRVSTQELAQVTSALGEARQFVALDSDCQQLTA